MATDGAWKIRTGARGVLASSWETQDGMKWLVTIIPRASVIPRALSRCSKPDFFHCLAVFDYCNMQFPKTRVLPPHRIIYFSFLKNNIQPSSAPSYSVFIVN